VTARTPGTGKLIAVAGIDGAGKSTLAASLHAALNAAGKDAILVGKHTTVVPVSADLSEYLDRVNAVVYRRKTTVCAASGDHYWLFALAAWYTLQDRHIIQPALRAGTHVVLDNAHHKILARYAVNSEVPTGVACQVFAHLTAPQVVLFLNVTPDQALARKPDFSSLEAGYTGSTGDAFIAYQDSVTEQLRQQADQTWVTIDVTGKAAGTVLEESLAILSARLGIQLA
jgi:thymidylate kinase